MKKTTASRFLLNRILKVETMFLLNVCAVRILNKTMQNPTQQCGACVVCLCVWRGACVTKIDEDRLQRRDRNKRNVCVLGITFSGEQQENADNSKHDGTRSILPKLRPCNVGVLGITFSGEQQENADNSKHDGTRSILPKLRPYIVSSVHLNRRTFYLPRVQRKERGLSPNG